MESTVAVITKFNAPLELWKVPVPDLEPGGVLTKVEAATLCGTDAHRWQGHLSSDKNPDHPFVGVFFPPYVPGHETCSTIVEMNGPRYDVEGNPLKPGDRVVSSYSHCGHCYYCEVSRQTSLCAEVVPYGFWAPERLLGGCSELHYFPPGGSLIRVPEHVTDEVAASASCALRTIIHGFEQLGKIESYESVLILASGPLGLYATAVALDRGAAKVMIIGGPEPRLQVAREWGAQHSLDFSSMTAAERVAWVREQTAGRGADVVINCATSQALGEAMRMVRPGGRIVQLATSGGSDVGISPILWFRGITVFSPVMAEARHFYQAIQFVATRHERFDFSRLISNSYSLDATGVALEKMAKFLEIKPVIRPNLAPVG